jgi:molybdenum ABC transporter molybdate-binding protein
MKKTGISFQGGSVRPATLAFVGSLAILAVLVALLFRIDEKSGVTPAAEKKPLVVFCAASLKSPVEAIAQDYQKRYGIEVQLQFGASQTLLANLEVAHRGDLYLPADDSYTGLARGKNLIRESLPLAAQQARIAVQKGNPKGIHSVADLLRDDVKLAQANPDAAAIGKLVRAALEKTGQWDVVNKKTFVFKGTVNDAAADVKLGAVDVSFGWDSMAKQYPDLDFVAAPELAGVVAQMSVNVLASAANPPAALHFARYLAANDRGLLKFKAAGFETVEGDAWAESPEIRMLNGAMLRPAIEQTITEFEQREGAHVTRVYNGCGILVAQMRAGARPDAYFACDASFMKQVNDLFLDPTNVSTNQLVILVKKGNPHGIHALADLAKPGLRVGVGHERQCALGALTKTTFLQGGVYEQVAKNIAVQSPTGDLLVNELRAGSLDAVVAYISNATNSADVLDAIAIDLPCATATQPLAVSKDSRQKQITARLKNALESSLSKERFRAAGFQWLADQPTAPSRAAPR